MWHTHFQPRPPVRWIFLTIYVLISLFVMGRYLLASNLGDTWRAATLEQMVYGSAERPYVYRRLVPIMSLAVASITPMEVRERIGSAMAEFTTQLEIMQAVAGQKRNFRMALEKTQSFYLRGVTAIIIYGFLWIFIIALYRLAQQLLPNIPAMALFSPIIGLLITPSLMVPGAYIYDIPALALATCCYLCLSTRNWKWFFFWFALACLNKETAIFITIFFALWFWGRMDRREFMHCLGLQLLVFAVIRFAIFWQFRHNPGIFLATSYIMQQAAMLIAGYSYKTLITVFFMIFLMVYRWQEKPPFARYGIALFVLMYLAYFFFGNPLEYRVFLDVVPLLAILVTHTLVGCTGISGISWLGCSKDFMPGEEPAMNDGHGLTKHP